MCEKNMNMQLYASRIYDSSLQNNLNLELEVSWWKLSINDFLMFNS